MKIKLLAVALLAAASLIPNADAGNRRSNNGGGNAVVTRSAVRSGGGNVSFRSMPVRNFSANRIYSGQRFSSVPMRSPRMSGIRSRPVNSNFASGQFARGSIGTNRINRFGNAQGSARIGSGFARNNSVIRNRTGSGQFQNGNRLASNWRGHVFGQRSANWQRNWARNRDHWWNGHRCHFFNGSWVIFDLGFSPWGPWWWDYPYYGSGYGYPYGYSYYPNGYNSGYGYNDSNDPGVYDSQPADQNGYDDQSGNQPGYQNGYAAQSANSAVAAAQDRLVRDGFYNGQIDGVLGPETRHALVRFQTKHGLRISGELTTETLDALGLRQYGNYGSN
jgi:hypothetical protein